ncbi:hypothetical protein KUCAC02_021309 [Chaenocephalus aceratus]|uniref:Uncharacterized protein n=1 Tax=Chaenocephalus aceratus TaxID=36190 RepID=A0ACB9XH96_CHAAC|nr:hypothetical protein KUCAC02_021309 [Chaenocephalus aceratus]
MHAGPSFLPSSRSSLRSFHPPGCPSVSMSLPRLEKGRNERKEMTDERKREGQPKGSDESALSVPNGSYLLPEKINRNFYLFKK